jgi:predicted alpha/beta superfamily hydrolase
MKRYAALVIPFLVLASLPMLTDQDYPREVLVPFGYEYTLHSDILQEDRSLLVSLPAGYQESGSDYPVLVLLDGSQHSLSLASLSVDDYSIPEMVIVTIVNTNRIRDLSTREVEYWAESGGSENFLRFIGEELLPFVDSTFRTSGYRIFGGGSAAGTFTLYAFIHGNELFDAYVAGSPAPGFYGDYYENALVDFLADKTEMEKSLYISLGEYDIPASLLFARKLAVVLEAASIEGLRWDYYEIPDKGHVPFSWLNLGLTELYRHYNFPISRFIAEGEESLSAHLEGLAREFKADLSHNDVFTVTDYSNKICYLIAKGRFEEAIRVARRGLLQYPGSVRLEYRMGQAYLFSGDKTQALEVLNAALAREQDDIMKGLLKLYIDQAEAGES